MYPVKTSASGMNVTLVVLMTPTKALSRVWPGIHSDIFLYLDQMTLPRMLIHNYSHLLTIYASK